MQRKRDETHSPVKDNARSGAFAGKVSIRFTVEAKETEAIASRIIKKAVKPLKRLSPAHFICCFLGREIFEL